MSDLVVIVYPTEAKAEEVRQRLLQLQKEYLIKLSDAVIATKTETGNVKLNQLVNTTTAGAVSGSFWGLLIGVIFLNPLLGVVIGAGTGALSGSLTDVGINDNFMKEIAAAFQPGTSALFILARQGTPDKVLEELKGSGGKIIQTSLSQEGEAKLQAALDAQPEEVQAKTE